MGGIKERESKYHSLKNKLLRRKNGEIKFEDWKTGINSISYGEDIFSSLIKLEQEKVRLLEYQKETSDQVLNIENQIKVTIDAAISALDEEMSTNQIRERGTLDLLERSLEFDHLQRDVALNESVVEHLSTSFQDVLIQASKEQEPVEVFEYAVTAIPIGSKRGKQVKLLSIALFPFLSIVLVVFMESQNTTLVMVEDVESFLDLTVLSIIPNIDHKDSSLSSKFKEIKDPVKARRLVVHYSPRSIQAEAFRSFRTNLDFMLMPGKGKTVLTTSSLMSEGKSNTLTNLAITYTQMNQRVLLVDCNMRRPTVHKTFGLDRGAGLVEILQESAKWQDNVKSIMDMVVGENVDLTDMMAGPGLDNLDVITSGSATPNPSGLLTTKIFAKFIEEVKSEYDIVLLDSPPLLHVTDASIIAPNVDAVVIIYEIGHTSKDALKRTKSILDNVKANIVGVVLNDIKSALDQSDYRSQYIKPYYSESANKKKIPFNLFSFFRKNPKQIEIDDIEIT
ncbi:MAG: AAA family ATPase [Calditrichaeota bacterium]|nr:AAA family ATPase [Calditrichota bacterium]MBT7790025.1 AAA family ATPase [Calditrichota bacterium]